VRKSSAIASVLKEGVLVFILEISGAPRDTSRKMKLTHYTVTGCKAFRIVALPGVCKVHTASLDSIPNFKAIPRWKMTKVHTGLYHDLMRWDIQDRRWEHSRTRPC
jgi:hypothetical protein